MSAVPTIAESLADPASGTLGVDLSSLTTVLLAAQKHAICKVLELRAENEELRAALAELTARVAALEAVGVSS